MSLVKDWRPGHPTLLSINNYYYRRGGADVVFLEQNRMFQEIDWNVVPFSMEHPDNLESAWSEYFVSEIEFGRLYSIGQKLVNAQKVVYSFEARSKLSKLIADTAPNIAHMHNIYHHISPSILGLLYSNNIPAVMTLHDLKLICPAYKMLTHDGVCERCKPSKIHNVITHRCIKNSLSLSSLIFAESLVHRILRSYEKGISRFIVPSRFYLEKMVEWGLQRERFSYIPNFVNCDLFEPAYAPGKEFVYFGRLSSEKGLRTLVEAAAAARVSLSVVGAGPDERALKSLASELHADVKFHGYQTGDELLNLIRVARAVVLPSEWYENAPLSVMESYALGKPVIGANIGGIPELIRNGETGEIFESGSVEDLTGLLRRFMNAPDEELETMGRKGRAWMETEFTAGKYMERLLRLYQEIGGPTLSKQSSGSPS